MKTRLIVLIISGVIISGSFAFVYTQMYDCMYPPSWMKLPRPSGFVNLPDCLEKYWAGTLPDYPTWEEYLESKAIKPEPEGRNQKLAELKELGGFIVETRTLRFPERTYTTLANHEDTKNEWFIVNGILAFGSEMHEVIIPTTLDLYTDDGKVTSVMSYVSLEETIEYAKTLELDSGYIDLNDYVDPNWIDGQTETLDEVPQVEPEPEQISDSESLQQKKQQQAKFYTQEIIMTDYRGHQHRIDAINEYRNEFESGYFLEQYIHTFDQDYNKDELINFTLVEWGYQQQECTFPKVEVYLRPYENYNSIEKISEWEKPKDNCFSIDSDENGYVIVYVRSMSGMSEQHETCTIPGEYRISVTNLKDTPDVEWGYFTCQKDKLVGNSEPWMDLPR